ALGAYCAFSQGRELRNGVLSDWLKRAASAKHLQKRTQLLSLFFSKLIPFVRILSMSFIRQFLYTHVDLAG
ncbi:MAG: hypothetical protein V7782_15920, partial [Psychromonas sp.]